MIRIFIVAFFVSCGVPMAWAQTQPAPDPTSQKAAASGKRVAKKPPQKGSTAANSTAAPENGRCQIGVIAAIGDRFSVQNIGFTVFGNELTEVPIEAWGLDDLVIAKVRSAAGAGVAVRRMAYARGAFEPYYHPERTLFRNAREELKTLVRQIAANSPCERYVVVTKYDGVLEGTNQELRGIGVYTNWTNGVFKKGVVFLNLAVSVFDGQSFDLREDPFANFGARLSASFSTKNDSFHVLENFEALKSPESAASNAALREGTRTLLSDRLDRVMPAYLKQ